MRKITPALPLLNLRESAALRVIEDNHCPLKSIPDRNRKPKQIGTRNDRLPSHIGASLKSPFWALESEPDIRQIEEKWRNFVG